MITAAQMRAARALLGMDQRALAELCDLSVPTIQRMEASEGVIRGNVDSLMKLVEALERAGIELIAEAAVSSGGGRGVRLKESGGAAQPSTRRTPRADDGREPRDS
jgi:transcriptional regulator with XRE-family HTH domain